MPSPVHADHSRAHGLIMGWLTVYCAATPGVDWHDNATVRLDMDNEVQPDALLRLETALGGRSRISDDNYVAGAPELIVEIVKDPLQGTVSSAAYDLHDKLKVYRRNGVQEYLVWQVYDQRLDWFRLDKGEYVPLTPDATGVARSLVFPGLNLAVGALLNGELPGVLDELRKGLETAEHATFVKGLAEGRET